MRDLMIDVGDLDVRVRVAGAGPPMLFTATGWGPSVDLYLYGLARLQERFTVAWLDPRATGRSGRPSDTAWSLDGLVADFERVRDALGWERMWVAGHSMGGHLALRYLAQHPDSCAGLLALCTYGDMDEQYHRERTDRMKARAGEPWYESTMEAFARVPRTDEEFGQAMSDRLPMYVVNQDAVEQLRAGLAPVSWSLAAFNYLAANTEMAILDHLGSANVPAVIIAAEGDFICSPPLGQRIHRAFDGSVFVEIAESGHFPWVEQPASFWEALDGALTSVMPNPQGT